MQFLLEFLWQHPHLHLPQQLQQPQPTNPVPQNAIKPSLFPPELYFSNRMPKHRTLRTKCQYRTFDIHHLHVPLPLTRQVRGRVKKAQWWRGIWLLLNNPKKSQLHSGLNDQSHALTTTCTLEVVFVLNIRSINTRISSVATFHSDQLRPSHLCPPKTFFKTTLETPILSNTPFLRLRAFNLLSGPPANKRTLVHPTTKNYAHRSDTP